MATDDIFNINVQAEFMRRMGLDLAKNARTFAMDKTSTALNPLSAIDTVVAAMRAQGVPESYVTAVGALKNDADVQAAIATFQRSLQGQANIHELVSRLPQAEDAAGDSTLSLRNDPGMTGALLTGEIDANGETDLVRFSNYLASSTAGQTFADLPQTVTDIATSITNATLYRYQRLQDQLDKLSGDLAAVVTQDKATIKQYATSPENALRQDKGYAVNPRGQATDAARIQAASSTTTDPRSKLLHTTFLANVELQAEKIKSAGRLQAQAILGKVGTGIQGVSGAFSVAMGGVNIGAGDQMIQNAERRLRNGEISQEQYDIEMRDARVRIARGAFGIGDGLNNIRQIFQDKIDDAVQGMSKGARLGARFASVVGGVLSIGMGVTSIAENAIAASDAQNSGNIGGAAVFGIMTALDCVSLLLDGASLVLDFVPGIGQAISFVVDLVNTIVGVVSMALGFFADLVDTRTPEEKLRAALDEHIKSPAFQKYLDEQANFYKDQGYDLFHFIVDAKALNLSEDGADATLVDKTIVRNLSAKAVTDAKNPTLRLALIDASSIGRELHGRLGDDLIRGGLGNDAIYGESGDDLLFGEDDDDTIYGGDGNDYLNGGTGRDTLFGEAGNDWLVMKPGIDYVVSGGAGYDTVEISSDFWALRSTNKITGAAVPNAIDLGVGTANRVYVDLSTQATPAKGRGGLQLGALLNSVTALSQPMHKPAFASGSAHETKLVNTWFWRGGETTVTEASLAGKYLWYLAQKDSLQYFTDGRYLYAKGTRNGVEGLWKATFDISTINKDVAGYDATNGVMTYTGDNQLEAIFVFAFRSTTAITGIEKVCESVGSSPSVYTDIHSCVIGDDNVSLIDINYGHNEYVYTGDADTVVSMSAAASPQWEIWKYIVGGKGENTLVINGSLFSSVTRPNGNYAKYQFMLLDTDVDFATANRFPNAVNQYAWPSGGGARVDRGIFLKNIQTIQLSNKATDDVCFQVDGSNLRDGHRFILDSNKPLLKLVGTAGDDNYLLKNAVGAENVIDGYAGRNLLSLDYFNTTYGITVDLEIAAGQSMAYLTAGSITIGLKNIHCVYGHPKLTSLKGNLATGNLLVAAGGACTVEGRGGDNTLVAERGVHTLVGGEGRDIYVIHGPEITGLTTLSVVKTKDLLTVANATGGTWDGTTLTIDLLGNDPAAIQLASAQLVDGNGVALTGKGTLAISADKRKLTYVPGTAFAQLPRYESETLRVKYTTIGSSVTIKESCPGNRIKLQGFANKDQIRFTLAANGDLECRDASGRLIFTDTRWGDLSRGNMTSIEALFVEFMTRFPELEFNGKDASNMLLKEDQLFDLLYAQLGNRITAPNNFDNMIDASTVAGNIIDLGRGDNTVFAKRKNVTYLGGSGNDIIDASVLTAVNPGTQTETLIKTGNGTDVVVIGNIADTVKVNFIADGQTAKQGVKALVVKGVDPNALGVAQSGTQLTLTNAGKTLAVLDTSPDLMYFRNTAQSVQIDDVAGYVAARKAGTAYNYRRFYNAKQEHGLRLAEFTRDQITIDIQVKSYGMDFAVRAATQVIYAFRAGIVTSAVVDAVAVAQAFQLEFKGGIVLKNETLDAPRIRELVMEKLRSPTSYTVVGGTSFTQIVDMSKVTSPYTAPAGDTLLFANKAGSSVQLGRGNNVVKITASNQTVGTGPSRNEATGHKIVQIQADLTNVTLNLSEPGTTSNEGAAYIIVDGATAADLSFTRVDGTSTEYYSSGPFKMYCRGRLLATIDDRPYYFVFRVGDEYEVVDSASYFVRYKELPRTYVNSKGLMAIKATDVTSADFKVQLDAGYSPPNIVFQSSTLWNVGQFSLSGMTSTLKSGDVAVKTAAQMPGGLRLRDRSYVGDDLVAFLKAKVEASTCRKVLCTVTAAAPTLTLAQATPTVNPYQHYLDRLRKTETAVTLARVDGPPLLRTSKTTFASGEAITFTITGSPGNPRDWIGIYPRGAAVVPGSSAWDYCASDSHTAPSTGITSGTVTIDANSKESRPWPLPSGSQWSAYYLVNDGFKFIAKVDFDIQ